MPVYDEDFEIYGNIPFLVLETMYIEYLLCEKEINILKHKWQNTHVYTRIPKQQLPSFKDYGHQIFYI